MNYILARLFVFKESKFPLLQEFIWYASIGVVGLLLNDFIIYLLVWLGVWYLYAKAVSVAVVSFSISSAGADYSFINEQREFLVWLRKMS